MVNLLIEELKLTEAPLKVEYLEGRKGFRGERAPQYCDNKNVWKRILLKFSYKFGG